MGYRIIVVLAIFLIILSHSGCEFESSEIWDKGILESDGEVPTAEYSFEDSVIYIDEAVTFEYSVSFVAQEIYLIEFYLDGLMIATGTNSTGSVDLNPSPGKHIFKIVVYTSTENGSIADEMNAEAFIYTQDWTVYMEAQGTSFIDITSISPAEGSLLIEWEPFQGYLFQSYSLVKRTHLGDTVLYESFDMFESQDLEDTLFYDEYYMGDYAEYFIRLKRSTGVTSDGTPRSYSWTPEFFNVSLYPDTTIVITWSKCIFDSNFGKYILSEQVDGGPLEVIFETTQLNDTTVTVPGGSGNSYFFKLEYVSKMLDATLGNGIYVTYYTDLI